MKIFNIENSKEKVYVQMNDIMMLSRTSIPIPASIFEKVFTGVTIVDNSNRMDFVEFSDSHEIAFFKKMDWIVDYKKVRNLSETEITAKSKEISNKINDIAESFNAMSQEKRSKNQNLIQQYELLEYTSSYLTEILWLKQGKISMPFPVVPDSDGFCLAGNDTFPYEMRLSLDPNKLLLYRKDGMKLSSDEIIPQGFFESGLSIAIMERSKNDKFFGDYSLSNSLSDDKRYLISQFSIKNYDDKENKTSQEQRVQEESKGDKKLIKRWFNKKKNKDKK